LYRLGNIYFTKVLIEMILQIARNNGSYKAILDCNESNVDFYEKCEMTKKEIQMVKYFC